MKLLIFVAVLIVAEVASQSTGKVRTQEEWIELKRQNDIFVLLQDSWEEITTQSAAFAVLGGRHSMEDRFAIAENMNGSGVSLFAIFDGHGGDSVAEFCKQKLVKTICDKIVETKRAAMRLSDDVTHDKKPISENIISESLETINELALGTSMAFDAKQFLENGSDVNYGKIITSEVLVADKKLVDDLRKKDQYTGSTAVIAVLDGIKLTVANVGDSRGVMCDSNGTAIALSYDHKPDGESEKKRIEKAGGHIQFWGVWRVNGILATSRALGDFYLKPNFVIANPDVLKFDLAEHRPQFMILASDGLWDVFTNQEAVDFISKHLDEPHFGAKSITIEAYLRKSQDNIATTIVVFKNGTYQTGSSSSDAIKNKIEEL